MTDWTSITSAVATALSGEAAEGRRLLLACWTATTDADHAQRCVLAHYLADLEDDLAAEVAWDERALAEHAHVRDDDLTPLGLTSAAALAPSLHLNLGDGLLRQGRLSAARDQSDAGLAATTALSDDDYGDLVRRGLAGLAQRVAATEG